MAKESRVNVRLRDHAKGIRASGGAAKVGGAPKDRQFVVALSRGLDILKCFSPGRQELGSGEIAALVGLPQPTVWRLCHTLMAQGYLVMSPASKKLRLGIPVLGLGYAVLASQPLAVVAEPEMRVIADRFQGAVSLADADATSMVILQRCHGSSVRLGDINVGARIPMASTATGWAYLAGLPAEQRASVIGTLRSGGGGKAWAGVERQFGQALALFEREGFIVLKGMLHEPINAVAVPVRTRGAAPGYALNSVGLSSIYTDDMLRQVGKALQKLAASLQSGT